MSQSILILAGDRVEDYELIVPQQTLQVLGFKVDITAPMKKPGELIQCEVHDARGLQTYSAMEGHRRPIDIALEDVDVNNYSTLIIPGGAFPEYVRMFPRVIRLVRDFNEAGKYIAAFCHGILVLTAADLIRGKKVTSYYVCEPEVRMAGGIWLEEDVVVDGNLITSVSYETHVPFLRTLISMLNTN